MVRSCFTIGLAGLQGFPVEVEADINPGLFQFSIVGLANKAILEARERIISAIKSSGFTIPYQRITINLAPAEKAKNGPAYDLPIALALLSADRQCPPLPKNAVFAGELSLSGSLRGIKGALVMSENSWQQGFQDIYLPEINAQEAGIISGITIFPVKSLLQIVNALAGKMPVKSYFRSKISCNKPGKFIGKQTRIIDFADISGQKKAKRALTIAAAGGHNLLFSGSPGVGKTYLAKAITGILPPMTVTEAIAVSKIHSIAGLLPADGTLLTSRPFRNPHYTCSYNSLIGGGVVPRPGEISLAHKGVLFLDEFNEIHSYTLEALRQPLEERLVNIARSKESITFPCDFILIAAMNPCKCGFFGDDRRACICSAYDILAYRKRISGPILDRIDLQVHINSVGKSLLKGNFPADNGIEKRETSEIIRKQVDKARTIQNERFREYAKSADLSGQTATNSALENNSLLAVCSLEQKAQTMLADAYEKLQMSTRGYFRCLKVARTIADLENSETVKGEHIAEAISFRTEN